MTAFDQIITTSDVAMDSISVRCCRHGSAGSPCFYAWHLMESRSQFEKHCSCQNVTI